MYEVEKLKSLGLRAPTSAQNSVANQTNLQLEQDSADPSPQTPPLQKGDLGSQGKKTKTKKT